MRCWRLPVVFVVFACGRTEPLSNVGAALDADAAGGRILDGGSVHSGTATSCRRAQGPSMAMPCTAPVRVRSLVPTMPGCFVDTPFRVGSLGSLRWDCGASAGGADLSFDAGRFVGSFEQGLVDVCFGSEFDWTDGCRWTSAQTVRGVPTAGARLSMTYAESPLRGQRACFVPCGAVGELEVLP